MNFFQMNKIVLSLKAKKVILGIAIFVIVILAGFTSYAFAFTARVLPRTYVAGISVGGLTKAQAQSRIATVVAERAAQEISVKYELKEWKLTAAQLGVVSDTTTATERAYALGRGGSFVSEMKWLVKALVQRSDISLPIALLGEKSGAAKDLFSSVERQATETTLTFADAKAELVPGVAGRQLDTEGLLAQVQLVLAGHQPVVTVQSAEFAPKVSLEQATAVKVQAEALLANDWKITLADQKLTLSPKTIASLLGTEVKANALALTLSQDGLKKEVAAFAKAVNREPRNAEVGITDGSLAITIPDVEGREVDQAGLVELLHNSLLSTTIPENRVIVGKVAVKQAAVRASAISDLGLKEVVGTATTDFSGSPGSRVANITVGTHALNGKLVMPGETYSTLGSLGPITEAAGYQNALVILNGKTENGLGGGLCQVSTTLFRAVLNAGMKITERTNHSYRVGYYEVGVGPGLDATIFEPSPDFKWTNDMANPVYITSSVSGNKVTFTIYGTKDGRSSSISAPQILSETPAPADKIIETDTMYVGERRQTETAHPGASTSVTYVVTNDGQETNRQVFRSYYTPWAAVFYVGTKQRPESPPTQ